MMLLVRQGRSASYAGKTYKAGETFDVDLAAHNARAHVRALKATGKCEDAPLGSPVGEVEGVRPAAPELFPETPPERAEPTAVEPDAPEAVEFAAPAEPEPAAPHRKGRKYQTRDLRAQD